MFFHATKCSFVKQKKVARSVPRAKPQKPSPISRPSPNMVINSTSTITKITYWHKIGEGGTADPQYKGIHEISIKQLRQDHPFVKDYLNKFILHSNLQLVSQIDEFIDTINFQRLINAQPQQYLVVWTCDPKGLPQSLIPIWVSYIQFQIRLAPDVHKFLTQQIYLFASILVSLFNLVHPFFLSSKFQHKLRFTFLNRLSQQDLLRNVMIANITKLGQEKGRVGEFTKQQILETVQQLQDLIHFRSITKPFQSSIKMMVAFSQQYHLKQKIYLLVSSLKNIKEQINRYRKHFHLESVPLGTDQILPIVNFVCESTGKNILTSVYYINAFLDHKKIDKTKLLQEISEDAYYCTQLVESAASIYCHASQFYEL